MMTSFEGFSQMIHDSKKYDILGVKKFIFRMIQHSTNERLIIAIQICLRKHKKTLPDTTLSRAFKTTHLKIKRKAHKTIRLTHL